MLVHVFRQGALRSDRTELFVPESRRLQSRFRAASINRHLVTAAGHWELICRGVAIPLMFLFICRVSVAPTMWRCLLMEPLFTRYKSAQIASLSFLFEMYLVRRRPVAPHSYTHFYLD